MSRPPPFPEDSGLSLFNNDLYDLVDRYKKAGVHPQKLAAVMLGAAGITMGLSLEESEAVGTKAVELLNAKAAAS